MMAMEKRMVVMDFMVMVDAIICAVCGAKFKWVRMLGGMFNYTICTYSYVRLFESDLSPAKRRYALPPRNSRRF